MKASRSDEPEIVKPKLDIVFKKLMIENKNVLKGFLSDILDIPKNDIGEITNMNTDIIPQTIGGKESELDLKMTVGDKIINIEIQLCNKGNFPERALYYWANMFSEELKRGKDYEELMKTICIDIVAFRLFDCDSAFSEFRLLETTRHEQLTDKCAIYFLELCKVQSEVPESDRKKLWMQLINAETKEELDMLEKTNIPEIKEAVTAISKMSDDELMRDRARLREKTIRDARAELNFAQQQGIAKGRAEGITEGRAERDKEIAANLRRKGYTEEQIADMLQ